MLFPFGLVSSIFSLLLISVLRSCRAAHPFWSNRKDAKIRTRGLRAPYGSPRGRTPVTAVHRSRYARSVQAVTSDSCVDLGFSVPCRTMQNSLGVRLRRPMREFWVFDQVLLDREWFSASYSFYPNQKIGFPFSFGLASSVFSLFLISILRSCRAAHPFWSNRKDAKIRTRGLRAPYASPRSRTPVT